MCHKITLLLYEQLKSYAGISRFVCDTTKTEPPLCRIITFSRLSIYQSNVPVCYTVCFISLSRLFWCNLFLTFMVLIIGLRETSQ